ncbi:MAG: acyl--CoA ligase [Gammaproteobacteria bacterium]|nr:acyl--CoA ligase [Gammaproteobacteria bacterium]
MASHSSVIHLIARGAAPATAISAPGRPDLTYGALGEQAAATIPALNALGAGRDDAVAIVLPNGPEMAVAFVAIAAGATTAPLNPGYTADEFEFYLQDLAARLLVVEAGSTSPAVAVARRLGIPVAELVVPPGAAAGRFELRGAPGAAARPGPAGAGDVALVLHTSGTTSRPKIVPLTHANVCASASHIATSLALTPADRCLQVMPLFHIHGLIAAVLSSLHAGASVCCTPGFNALHFFGWLRDVRPTWYTAVPTMHQAILARAARNRDVIGQVPLRFIRSSSASLPPQVMTELEATFGCPLIEAYGMTEAAHQMTSNPLPPGARFAGSVGVAAGPDVGIMDEQGGLLPPGDVGEVVIRGPNVTPGYRNNQSANASAFTNGWFRTGDQGVMDAKGYLRLTGRLKEIINRGGEKISPREVDEVLLDHPAVAQVVTFAVPHPMLGEDVAAAVVLRPGAEATERDLRRFAGERLADMKVPRKILFLEEIPKGATGKLQRIGLAAKLGLG